MFSATVALKRNGSSLTTAITARSEATSTSRTSVPSTSTAPALTSYRRGMSCTSVVLPEPVAPTSATVLPAGTSRSTSRSAGRWAGWVGEVAGPRRGTGGGLGGVVLERHRAQLDVARAGRQAGGAGLRDDPRL